MAVTSTPTPQSHARSIDDDLGEFVSLLGETLHRLKHAGLPPAAQHDAVESSALGDRHGPALLAVALSGPLSVSELAKRLGLGLSTTSTIVGQLSRAGLLARAEDEDDRRRTIVRLHDDYRATLDAWLVRALAPVRVTLERLSPAARAEFMDGWRRLHDEACRANSPGSGVGVV